MSLPEQRTVLDLLERFSVSSYLIERKRVTLFTWLWMLTCYASFFLSCRQLLGLARKISSGSFA